MPVMKSPATKARSKRIVARSSSGAYDVEVDIVRQAASGDRGDESKTSSRGRFVSMDSSIEKHTYSTDELMSPLLNCHYIQKQYFR